MFGLHEMLDNVRCNRSDPQCCGTGGLQVVFPCSGRGGAIWLGGDDPTGRRRTDSAMILLDMICSD